MARSSESYTNEQDCVNAAVALFRSWAQVWVQQADGSSVVARETVV